MSADFITLATTIAGSVIGATWLLRSKLGDIESALRAHIAESNQQFRGLRRRVSQLEKKK
jgi:hypothetical protein